MNEASRSELAGGECDAHASLLLPYQKRPNSFKSLKSWLEKEGEGENGHNRQKQSQSPVFVAQYCLGKKRSIFGHQNFVV